MANQKSDYMLGNIEKWLGGYIEFYFRGTFTILFLFYGWGINNYVP